MPVPSGEYGQTTTVALDCTAVQDGDDFVATCNPKRPAWQEITLDVDDDQRITGLKTAIL